MTPNSTVLTSSVTPSSSISVLTASGAFVPVRQVGAVTRSSDPSGRLSLDAVYHVPQLSLSFLSVGQLGYYITLTSSGCVVQDRHSGTQIGTGRTTQGRQSYKPTVIVTSSRLCYTGLLNQSIP
jgi:hypothetical protein